MSVWRQSLTGVYSGGIRGVVELEILSALEKEIGGKIPIQEFFDLIVGTRYVAQTPKTDGVVARVVAYSLTTVTIYSTGGIIAIALGIKQISVTTLIQDYAQIIDRAFMPRYYGFSISKYRTTPIENLLQDYFGQDNMFGGPQRRAEHYYKKVAVTSASDTISQAFIFTNYNRLDTGKGKLWRTANYIRFLS